MSTPTLTPDAAEIRDALGRAGVADADDRRLTRSLYASDASLYRVEPKVVVRPRDADEVIAALDISRRLGVPVTSRGAGTSIAGNAVGSGIVLDFSRHMNKVLRLDPEAGTALVQPGTVHATLQRAAATHGWRFGPDPSTHNRCTLGGMIGNNACGSRALGYGRTVDNVLGLNAVCGNGERLTVGTLSTGQPAGDTAGRLQALIDGELAIVRTEFGRFSRQVSGYQLQHLLPENDRNLGRALVGSEGTLAVTLAAEVSLVRDSSHRMLVALGYPSMEDAADAVLAVLPFGPVACEGLDASIVDVVRQRRGTHAVPDLPAGAGWLFVELAGENLGELRSVGTALAGQSGAKDHRVITDSAEIARLWKIREDGSGLVARGEAGRPMHAGWEDAAVPPQRLGAYLREFRALLAGHDLTGVPYGHFGDGCVHVRIDFPLDAPEGGQRFRAFLVDAAELVASYGGSISGEHGDGRARSELLPYMYSPEAITLFAQVKRICDPDGRLNPGVIVDPAPVAENLRESLRPRRRERLTFAYHRDGGRFENAVHRCTGVGKCRVERSPDVMCPSYRATNDEKDSTRGRARVLQDAMNGRLGQARLRAPEVREALDLCLACKGCSSDCPTGVDMATYKAEVLHATYRRRLRPRNHYSLGRLPDWARVAVRFSRLINWVLGSRLLHRPLAWLAGVDARRTFPRLARGSLRSLLRDKRPRATGRHGEVVLFADTFTSCFTPEVGLATVAVLQHAGWGVRLPESAMCCGLTLVSTGQLDAARRRMRRTVQRLLPHVRTGRLIVGIEPSCTALLRSDLVELLDTEESREVAAAVVTLAELLERTPDYVPPSLAGLEVVAQPHCHHHAVMSWSTDARLLQTANAKLQQVGGCCGLAGNFGVERGHHDLSTAVAAQQLLPAVERAPGAVVLADGFSCRTQLEFFGHRGTHLAELLHGRSTNTEESSQ